MIDAFGHSLGNIVIQRSAGLKGMIINRIDDVEKSLRSHEQKLDFNWQFESSFNYQTPANTQTQGKITDQMTTRVMNMHYSFPIKFFAEGSSVFNNPLSSSFKFYLS
jgi:hypothetical protein